ncbi:hypothetical protein GCM10023091_20360 [Ravibacter arvi]|uniref:FecR family protein n=1 Tax=Ravibacter arvi TaxID=2051041 RepID=A0ABP8LYE4_9BACT
MGKDEEFEQRLTYLFQLLSAREATPEEKEEFFRLISETGREEAVNDLLGAHWANIDPDAALFAAGESEHLLKRIQAATEAYEDPVIPAAPVRSYRLIYRIAAASILLLLLAGSYLVLVRRPVSGTSVAATFKDIAPGGEKAMLTLADGRQIALDDVPVGVLAARGDVTISKPGEGALVYHLDDKSEKNVAGQATEYHIVSTPVGGKYKVVLPDGSRVWLNAATTLRYPIHFEGPQRRVELTGEAYLEVNTVAGEAGRRMPFQVLSGGQLVEVLGTHFNINSYEDEKTAKTTLLEGSVRVRSRVGGHELKLVPGQRSELSADGKLKLFRDADLEDAVAWKDDFFSFNGSDVYSVMRQISRWYDVEVQFEPGLPREHMTGYISRKVPLSGVVAMLEQTSDLRFRLEGRKVTVGYR